MKTILLLSLIKNSETSVLLSILTSVFIVLLSAEYTEITICESTICELSNEFLNSLIEYYKNYTQLREELAAFRHPKKEYKLYDLVRMFVYKICFRENNGQNKLNYRGMYELGMLISKLTKEETREERKKEKREDSSIFQMNLDENSPEYHHLEELKDRAKKNDDDQMRLF